MVSMRGVRSSIVVVLMCAASQAQAQSLRCEGKLAVIGDSKPDVLQKCGNPMYQDSYCKPGQQVKPGAACNMIDAWTYDPGSGQLLTTLKFEGGQVTGIAYGARSQRGPSLTAVQSQ